MQWVQLHLLFQLDTTPAQTDIFLYLNIFNLGCDRIPIESLELDSPECIFVMVLASVGKSKQRHLRYSVLE